MAEREEEKKEGLSDKISDLENLQIVRLEMNLRAVCRSTNELY